ncbi:TorF family putative porin [Bradyrhizobium sp. UFLA05-153]
MGGVSIAAFVGLWLAPVAGNVARAETAETSASGAIGLGNRAWSAAETSHATSVNELEFSARAGVASDYVYRGTTLSGREPAAGAAFEARFGSLYAGATMATVRLPTEPVGEFTVAGGIRPKIADINFDLGVTYFAYPGEKFPGVTNGINYWEAAVRGDRSIGESFRIAAGYAYSPNVSNTGAWSQYLAAGLGCANPPASEEPGRVVHDGCRLFLVRQSGSATRQLPVTCLSQLASGRDLYLQGRQLRSALLRHQSVERKLLRLYWRSKCAGGWPRLIPLPTPLAWSRTGVVRRSSPKPGSLFKL